MKAPVDPVQYLRGGGSAVQEFLLEIQAAHQEFRTDSFRLLTIYTVHLQSTKRLRDADVTVGISGIDNDSVTTVEKRVDPNKTHPLRQKDVIPLLNKALQFGPHEFQAITRVHRLRNHPRYCWKDEDVNLIKWSHDIAAFINMLTLENVMVARRQYGETVGRVSAAKNREKRGATPQAEAMPNQTHTSNQCSVNAAFSWRETDAGKSRQIEARSTGDQWHPEGWISLITSRRWTTSPGHGLSARSHQRPAVAFRGELGAQRGLASIALAYLGECFRQSSDHDQHPRMGAAS